MTDDILTIAKALISVPGFAELPEKEGNTARKLMEYLDRDGLETRIAEAAPGRYNVICRYPGTGGGRTLVLCTHLDTVPAGGMADAFIPVVRDGRLYGRGAVDVKDILAAMAVAMQRLAKAHTRLAGDVIFLAVADEESGSAGMRSAVKDPVIAQADLAVVGEPTDLEIGIAHKGVEWVEVVFQGIATHGANPEKGINAVYHANRFVSMLTGFLIPRLHKRVDPLLGPSTLNVGYFHGGTRPTIVPDECTVRFDRRYLPSENIAAVLDEIESVLDEMKREDPSLRCGMHTILGDKSRRFPPLSVSGDDPCVQTVRDTARAVLGREVGYIGLPFWTDAALMPAFCGKPAVVIGPGNVRQAHSNEEYVDLAELEKAGELYYRIALAFCEKPGEREA